MRKNRFNTFPQSLLCGYLLCIASNIFEKNFVGKERWLERASETWIDGKYAIPLAIAITIIAAILFILTPEEK